MSPRSIGMSEALHSYILEHSTTPTNVQQQLIDRTEALGAVSRMQISPEQGVFLAMLVRLLQPKLIVEVGTFTGYSSLAMAQALGDDGHLIACDVSEEWTAVAREHWDAAGVGDKVDLRIAPATDTLEALGNDVAIDMAFIDADKGGYLGYYEAILSRLSANGVILVDNTLWSGAVVDPDVSDGDTEALRVFNAHVQNDDRVTNVLLPIGDGLTMITRS